jgi:hypothetical protein
MWDKLSLVSVSPFVGENSRILQNILQTSVLWEVAFYGGKSREATARAASKAFRNSSLNNDIHQCFQ